MENFSLAGITAAIILDERRSKKNGLYPVKYRVTFLTKRTYYPSGLDLSLSEWDSLPHTKKRSLLEVRELLQAGFDRIKGHIKDLHKGDGFSIQALNIRLSRGMKNSILSSFYDKIERLHEAGQVGTSDCYMYALKNIQRFTGKDLKFSEITTDWLKRYEDYLLKEDYSYTTISMFMRALRCIINEGKNQGIINQAQYPFGEKKYQLPTESGRKMALTLAQIGEVLKYPLLTDSEKRYRDLWFFSYLCNGINMNDLLRLRYSDISEDEITWYRQKTIKKSRVKKKISATLLPEMKQIIDKWGSPDRSPDSFIFPHLHDGLTPTDEKRIVKNQTRLINYQMLRIGQALGFGRISTYTARHSYATVLKRSGANIAFISESLGHSDLKTTENYLDSFEKEERIKNAALLTNFEK